MKIDRILRTFPLVSPNTSTATRFTSLEEALIPVGVVEEKGRPPQDEWKEARRPMNSHHKIRSPGFSRRRFFRSGGMAAVAAALYSISGDGPPSRTPEGKEIKRDEFIDRAVAARDEHAIRFMGACLRESQLNPGQIHPQAAWDAVERLRL